MCSHIWCIVYSVHFKSLFRCTGDIICHNKIYTYLKIAHIFKNKIFIFHFFYNKERKQKKKTMFPFIHTYVHIYWILQCKQKGRGTKLNINSCFYASVIFRYFVLLSFAAIAVSKHRSVNSPNFLVMSKEILLHSVENQTSGFLSFW